MLLSGDGYIYIPILCFKDHIFHHLVGILTIRILLRFSENSSEIL